MGFFRGLGKFFGGTLFSLFLVLAILMIDIVNLTSYDNFKSLIGGVYEQQLFSSLSADDLTSLHSMLIYQCSQTDKVSLPIMGDQPVILKCDDIKNSDTSQIPNLILNSLTESLYYKTFSCSFIDCIKKGISTDMLIVFSNEGNQLYKSLQTYMWIGTGVGLILLLVCVRTWSGRLKSVGWNLVFTGLPFLLLTYLQSRFIPALPQAIESSVQPIIDNLMSSIKSKFIIVLVIGIVLLVAGYVIGFLSRKPKSGKKK